MVSEEDAWRCKRCGRVHGDWKEGEVVCPVCAANEVND